MKPIKQQCQIAHAILRGQSKEQQFDQTNLKQHTINQLITREEFVQLSNEIKVAAERRESLVNSLYAPAYVQKQFKFSRQQQKATPYQQLYMSWKNQQCNECTFDSTYKSTLALLDKQKRHSQFKRLINQSKIPQPIYKFKEENSFLKTTSNLHQQHLTQTLNSQFNAKTLKNQSSFHLNTEQAKSQVNSNNKQKAVEIAIQRQLLKRISQINKQQQQEKQRLVKQKQMEKRCYVDFILNPILITQKQRQKIDNNSKTRLKRQPFFNDYTVQLKKSTQRIKNNQKKKEQKVTYKLNVQQILRIRPKEYLIFYSDNYQQILRLASPEQMKQLNNYRDQCLKKEEALSKLKQKVAQYGPQYIKTLNPLSREKLFQLLYHQDIQIQKNYNQ